MQKRPPALHHEQAFFLYTALLKILDAGTVAASWQLCWWLRFQGSWIPVTKGLPEYTYYLRATLPLVLVFLAAFHIVGAYRRDRVTFGFRALKKTVEASVVGTLIFVAILYFQYQFDYSRIFLGLFTLVVIVDLITMRALFAWVWRKVTARVVAPRKILLIGSGPLLQMYYHQIQSKQPYQIQWLGTLGESLQDLGIPYLGRFGEVRAVVEAKKPDVVVFSHIPSKADPLLAKVDPAEILEQLSHEPVTVKVIPDFGKYNTFIYRAEEEWGIPLLAFNEAPLSSSDRFVKRLLDFFGALFLIVFFLPIATLIALLIKLSSRGPIFFGQTRVGADGKRFTCYKFRSMKIDAEEKTGPVFAQKEDPRTTSIGKYLRRTSLDELPQLFNVLRGEMSLVGPRPERPVFVDKFKYEIPKYQLRHKLKSGLTGWAQINGLRQNTSLEERVKYDLYYIGHWSFWLDLKIILLTPFKGMIQSHAY